MKNNKDFVKILIKEMNQSYQKSGLEKPHLADLNKDKKINSYEKKRGKAVEKNVKEGHEGTDHEVSMALNSIESIIWAANKLKKHLEGGERDIPAWIQDHITNADNYIVQAAKNYHEYGDHEGEEDQGEEEYGDYDFDSEPEIDYSDDLGSEDDYEDDYESEEEFEEPTDSEEYEDEDSEEEEYDDDEDDYEDENDDDEDEDYEEDLMEAKGHKIKKMKKEGAKDSKKKKIKERKKK